jgi:hypothetical protein
MALLGPGLVVFAATQFIPSFRQGASFIDGFTDYIKFGLKQKFICAILAFGFVFGVPTNIVSWLLHYLGGTEGLIGIPITSMADPIAFLNRREKIWNITGWFINFFLFLLVSLQIKLLSQYD